jgi:hypothetical protein
VLPLIVECGEARGCVRDAHGYSACRYSPFIAGGESEHGANEATGGSVT